MRIWPSATFVGSNILNILAVLAIPALLAPQAIAHVVLWRDYGVMIGLTALLVLFAYASARAKVITRFEGCRADVCLGRLHLGRLLIRITLLDRARGSAARRCLGAGPRRCEC